MDKLMFRTFLVLITTVVLGACSTTPAAFTDYDPAFAFGEARAVAIKPLNRSVTSQTVISDMAAQRMNTSLARALDQRGIVVVDDPAKADLWLTWHLVTQERTDVRTYNTMSAHYSRCWSCPMGSSQNVRVRQFTQGTMIVDMLDPAQDRSVWRSVFESRLRPNMSSDEAEELRNTAAQALFADFPP